ncbi:4Fe-4S ferredoxin [Desulfovibrio sp. Fe33]|uniref:4Fe-4S ferredoxin n=1 Tax=Desulfovibrio sp. Fe33 TaxID=3020842 RepID=UPI00234D264E|nr:4Fe-4S ferredoxin [Desulfovibrio sp. Fe33]
MNLSQLSSIIDDWMAVPGNNSLGPGLSLPAFDTPLVGCAAGDDPLFDFLKRDIGAEFYWTPEEAFALAFPEAGADGSDLSVVSWVLPQTRNTRQAHGLNKELPSIEWSRARHYGEMVNEALRRFVVRSFEGEGVLACAPALLPMWTRAESSKYGFASTWSERHTAHVCGLGTFGLSDGLITARGKAIRVGSVVVQAQLAPTPRTYTHHNEWCLFHAKGKCRACIKRCPAGAISEKGHDKVKCKAYIRTITAAHVEEHQLGFRVNSCGLCQVRVPCESRNPTAVKSE